MTKPYKKYSKYFLKIHLIINVIPEIPPQLSKYVAVIP